jgi:rubrerythrin
MGSSRSPLIFEETASQEKEHAKRFFKFLQGGEVKIECAFPAGVVGTAAVKKAIEGRRDFSSLLRQGPPAMAVVDALG